MFDLTELLSNQWILLSWVGSVTCFVLYVKHKQSHWKRHGVDGPKPMFLFGNTLDTFLQPSMKDGLTNNYKKFGRLYGSYLALSPNLVVSDPQYLKYICVKDFHVFPQGFPSLGWLCPVEEAFLISIWGERWKRLRAIITPTFTSAKMRSMFSLIISCNQALQKHLSTLTADAEVTNFDPKDFWSRYNLDVIARCCFAGDLNVYDTENDEMLEQFKKSNSFSATKLFLIFALPEKIVQFFRLSGRNVDALSYLRDLTLALIEERKKSNQKPNDFLQSLIELSDEADLTASERQSKLTHIEVVGSCVVFLIAGYETTSTLLTWACYRLARDQEIQNKLYDEVAKADLNDYEVVSTLPYLDAVINETLRIDPPIIMFQRVAHEDYVLPGTEIFIPKGTQITIPAYCIQHDSEYYPEPETFDPERFISKSPEPLTFLPFGAGPRQCIGMRFALVNAKLALASFIRSYKVLTTAKTPEKLEFKKATIMMEVKELHLGIQPRSR